MMPSCKASSRLVSQMWPSKADIMTTEHLLQHSQLNDALKRDMWPEQIALTDKLYGNLEELKRTAGSTDGQALWQPGGAEEDSLFREGDRHLRLA